jgi:hypothetical protein
MITLKKYGITRAYTELDLTSIGFTYINGEPMLSISTKGKQTPKNTAHVAVNVKDAKRIIKIWQKYIKEFKL